MMCCCVTMAASAQSVSWNSLIDALEVNCFEMKLEKYGIYQNGQEITVAYPSESAGNAQEGLTLALTKERGTYALEMNGTMDGWSEYIGLYSGNVLNHKKYKHKGDSDFSACGGFWRLLSFSKSDGATGDQYRIAVLDEHNIYRYYVGEVPDILDELMYLLL